MPLVHLFIRLVARVVFGLRETGREFIPSSGPVILASNHISDWDPPVLGMASSRVPYYMAKSELFKGRVARFLLGKLGAFPVNRTGTDTGAMRTAIQLLKRGEVLAMFPEGTRNRKGLLGKARHGIALVARRGGAPVVPAYISGTMKPRRGLRVAFGRPISCEEVQTAFEKDGNTGLSDLVMKRIADAGIEAGIFNGYAEEDERRRDE